MMKIQTEKDARNEIVQLVLDFFGGDALRTVAWFNAINPMLGNATPNEMIAAGRTAKLLRWVKVMLDENTQP